MKITAIRHGPFSPVNGGRPTPTALKRFLRLLNAEFHFNVVVSSSVPRTKELAIRAAHQHRHRLIIIEEFNPLETTKFPPLFGGWLYELLHRWQIFNHLMLILWWNGFPIFTEGPIEFLERTKKGLQILQKMAQTDDTLLICHQETIIALMILDGKRPFDALKKRIPHFYTYDFFTTD